MTAHPRFQRSAVSFQSRITGAALITAVAVLLAACAAFVAEQWRADRREVIEQHTALAEVLAGSVRAREALLHPETASDVTEGLAERIRTAAAVMIVDAEGRLLSASGATGPEAARARRLLRAAAPVAFEGRALGEVVIYAAPRSISGILPRYLALAGALFFAATGLALFLGRWLAGRVTEPVHRLSQMMREVADSGDFAQQVERSSEDELGLLTDSFNDLLVKLNDNDRALRQTMAELVDARDTAETANRLKSQFLANMSHEIRTPLNGLLAMAQVMALEDMRPAQRQRLQVIRESGEALLAILNDVLDVSKIEAGKLELETADFDTELLARSVYATFAPIADKKRLSLVLDLEPAALGVRHGDEARLRQVLNNLVANALKFTPAGEVRLSVQGVGEQGRDGLRFSVADTGIGIAPAALPLLFQKFTQADSSTTRRFGGTGLGLAICQELAGLMGGRIWVESVEGEGSTFHVLVPLPRSGEAPAPEAADQPAPEADAGQDIRVLAAEDNPTNQLVLSTVMEIFGVQLTLVENGRLAVEAWSQGEFDVILMDIQMPEMDGMSAARAIRAAEAAEGRARTPIIALSAHAMTHQVKEYLEAGIDLHVPKPIELPRLQAALEAALRPAAERTGASAVPDASSAVSAA